GRDLLQQAPAAQRRIDRVRDQRAIAPAEVLVVAEELPKLRVRGRARRQDDRQCVDDRVELGAAEAHRDLNAPTRAWRPGPPSGGSSPPGSAASPAGSSAPGPATRPQPPSRPSGRCAAGGAYALCPAGCRFPPRPAPSA